jgi:tyrosyl-tRNA synthetase
MNLYDEFQWRGMLYEATPELREVLAKEKVTAYIGFDPSAPSLHVGSLLPIMGLARLQRFGHTPIAIAGGGTGLIGDPSGKTKERMLLTREQVEENLVGIKEQLSHFLDFNAKENPARIVNNADWLGPDHDDGVSPRRRKAFHRSTVCSAKKRLVGGWIRRRDFVY